MAKDSFAGLGGMMVPALDLERSDRKMRELMAKIPSIWETQARMYMEGLKAQSDALAKTLGPNQEVEMNCWHGTEKLKVLSVSLPSENVVALRCVDDEGATVQVTGHMNSLTFSFRVSTIVPPAVRKQIGFVMPNAG
jgi:hypothetical protein